MCGASEIPRSVKPTITRKYIKTCGKKTDKRSKLE
jgi:hypothetical protein